MKYLGDATIGVSLSVQTPKPLDARLVVSHRKDLYEIPKLYAYEGMPVVCIADGNIYTLQDKNNINSAVGWKASYEAVQIITCTEAEYNEWQSNTTTDYTPIDETKTYLHLDTYYYIYEDSIEDKGLYYVNLSLFNELSERVNNKASISRLESLSAELQDNLVTIANTYSTKEEVNNALADKVDNATLDNYYDKEETDKTFVTKESLKGEGLEGDNYVFVTEDKYKTGQETLKKDLSALLNTKVDVKSDAVLNSVETNTIKYGDTTLTLANGIVTIDGKIVADNITDIVCLSEEEYKALGDLIKSNTYYFTYGDTIDSSGYVTAKDLNRLMASVLANVTKLSADSTLEDCINKINEIIDKYAALNK